MNHPRACYTVRRSMDRVGFLNRFHELLDLPAGTLNGRERLVDLASWNSVAVIGFLAMANEEDGLVLSPRKISDSQTVNDLLDLVAAS